MICCSVMKMPSFALTKRKEPDMKSEIRFVDRDHLAFYNQTLNQTGNNDPYRKARMLNLSSTICWKRSFSTTAR